MPRSPSAAPAEAHPPRRPPYLVPPPSDLPQPRLPRPAGTVWRRGPVWLAQPRLGPSGGPAAVMAAPPRPGPPAAPLAERRLVALGEAGPRGDECV
ncbi:translation initiation factor IF-2-like [Pipra filicauda]|uniref:Translation initiation factor IF-2-like n=1 Tax=Pipra filicauda TaxID=649802 RepID=A0A7R5KIA0_9PASS|nr:translation initiation factor IF-2-like [Pipra filicauda]